MYVCTVGVYVYEIARVTLTLVTLFLGTLRSMSSGSSPSIWMSSEPSALSWCTRPEKKNVPPTGIIFTTSPTHKRHTNRQIHTNSAYIQSYISCT